jgi:hypothetical protein
MRIALALACLLGVAACGGGLSRQAAGGGSSGGTGAGGHATGGAGNRPPGILRVQGESIVDDTDSPVALHGVAFGNAEIGRASCRERVSLEV